MKAVGKGIGIILLILLILFGVLLVYLSVVEYRPEDEEILQISENQGKDLTKDNTMLVYGYWLSGLGKSDFFMDGGKDVHAISKEAVEANMSTILTELKKMDCDFYLLQEVDENSKRSYHVNERQALDDAFGEGLYTYNYKVNFVPYPWPPLGKVASGLWTGTDYQTMEAKRVALPVPFSWPVRTVNLKRAMLVSRHPLDDGKEFVLINAHLEAYDDGEGKKKQTLELLDFMNQEYEKGNYVLVGGDWNQTFYPVADLPFKAESENWTPGEIPQELIPEGWSLATGAKDAPTCRLLDKPYAEKGEGNTHYIIDGFLVSPNIEILKVTTENLNFYASDHNPVRLSIKLR